MCLHRDDFMLSARLADSEEREGANDVKGTTDYEERISLTLR